MGGSVATALAEQREPARRPGRRDRRRRRDEDAGSLPFIARLGLRAGDRRGDLAAAPRLPDQERLRGRVRPRLRLRGRLRELRPGRRRQRGDDLHLLRRTPRPRATTSSRSGRSPDRLRPRRPAARDRRRRGPDLRSARSPRRPTRAVPGAEVEMLDGVGHSPNVEAPEATTAALIEAVRRRRRRTPPRQAPATRARPGQPAPTRPARGSVDRESPADPHARRAPRPRCRRRPAFDDRIRSGDPATDRTAARSAIICSTRRGGTGRSRRASPPCRRAGQAKLRSRGRPQPAVTRRSAEDLERGASRVQRTAGPFASQLGVEPSRLPIADAPTQPSAEAGGSAVATAGDPPRRPSATQVVHVEQKSSAIRCAPRWRTSSIDLAGSASQASSGRAGRRARPARQSRPPTGRPDRPRAPRARAGRTRRGARRRARMPGSHRRARPPRRTSCSAPV